MTMANKDYSNKTIWGIHGGRTGDADSIFLKKNQMTIGWIEMGDLGKHEIFSPAKTYPPVTMRELADCKGGQR
jgi:hypothetical protein